MNMRNNLLEKKNIDQRLNSLLDINNEMFIKI